MDGHWTEDGSFEVARGKGTSRIKGIEKGKRKGKKKGKGKGDEPDAKRQRVDGSEDEPAKYTWTSNGIDVVKAGGKWSGLGSPTEGSLLTPEAEEQINVAMFVKEGYLTKLDADFETEEEWYEREWHDREVCLINLNAAALNGVYGRVIKNMGIEKVLVDGKWKKIRRFTVALEAAKGEKSIKMENLFKVDTGSLVKLKGLDDSSLNDTIAECGRLDAASMRYDVTLSDGRHIKVKPSNAEMYARYETSKVSGDKAQMEWVRNANGLHDILGILEWFHYPVPAVLPTSALVQYTEKFSKSIVIGQSKAGNPKGIDMLKRELTSTSLIASNARIVYISMPRERTCISPPVAELRHDDLMRIGKFAGWVAKRCAPRPVFFLLASMAAKGPTSLLNSATCAWPLYLTLCTDIVVVESDRWQKSHWARLDALLGAVWGRKPMYLLPEKYTPPLELGDSKPTKEEDLDEDVQNDAKTCPFSFRELEPFTIERPQEDAAAPLLKPIADRALEAEGKDTMYVSKPTLGIKRLG
mmetsp:Transcript_11238/g.18620  ORF Transcript_11238/g.18620 Transcript_11238/m.18620 type:complete len:526 (+) Transcript_11238:54-1631(+)